MTNTNKITLAIIIALTIVFAFTLGTLNKKIESVATSTIDISSSTLKVVNGTTTIDVPTVDVLQYMSAEIFCIKNTTAEGCIARASTSATSTR